MFKGSTWKNGGVGDGFEFRLGFMANDTLRTSYKGVDSSRAFNVNFHNPHQMVKLLLFTVGITPSCFLGQKPLISTFNE